MALKSINLILILIGFGAVLRVIPYMLAPHGAGVDHWFWKKYIETYRQHREFPPVLPQYLLDEYQWYPPLFPLIMMRLPAKFFDRWNHILAVGVDLIRMLLLLFIAAWLSGGDLHIIVLSGLIYATTPIQISYNFQLNPRGLAALFLDSLLILLLWFYSYHGPWWAWLLVFLLSGLILLTHKMTTQLFWFICLCCTFVFQDLRLLMLIPVSMLVAIVLSRGFYIKILVAHIDIVNFWRKHWRWIGADVIRESPIYGDKSYQRPQKLHQTGLKGFIWHCFILFGFNPASWIGCLLIFERLFISPHVLIYSSWLIIWLLTPCLLSVLTTFISFFRCIGAGYLYLYNTSLITSLLLAMAYRYTKSPNMSSLIYIAAFVFNVLGVILFYWKFLKNKHSRVDQPFNRVLEKLKELPQGTVWCIPAVWHEAVAYKTPHFVLGGGHGYGFDRLTPIFPRLLISIKEVIQRYKVCYLLTMDNVLTNQCISDLPKNATIIREEDYVLYVFL